MITIRPIQTLADMKQAETVQKVTWDIDDLEIVNVHTLHALVHNGAILLGAYDGDQLIGFCLGILGLTPAESGTAVSRLKIYSFMAGVLPTYQSQGVGYQLKVAQRHAARQLGISLMTWTYDPLESRNAYFNIARLGAICHHYHADFHGQMGGINVGLPTDRFEVSWWLDSDRVKSALSATNGQAKRPFSLSHFLGTHAARPIHPLTPLPNTLPHTLLVEIPTHFQALKQQNLALAQAWRQGCRQTFPALFAQGYMVTDFGQEVTAENGRRSFYILTQTHPPGL